MRNPERWLAVIVAILVSATAFAQDADRRGEEFLGRWIGQVPITGSPIDLQLNIASEEQGLLIEVTALSGRRSTIAIIVRIERIDDPIAVGVGRSGDVADLGPVVDSVPI